MIKKYDVQAQECYSISNRSSHLGAFFFFAIRIGIFGFFVYSYYIATLFVEHEINNPSTDKPYMIDEIVSITQALIISMFATLQLQTHIQNIIQGKICAKKVFDIIRRDPEIKNGDSVPSSKILLNREIKFKDVEFRYPTAPETQPNTL